MAGGLRLIWRSYLLLLISANLVAESLQDLLGEHAGTAELGALFHELEEYVFSIPADASKALDINHELTTA